MLGSWKKTLELAFINHRLISEVNRTRQVNWQIIDLGIRHVTEEHINEVLDQMLLGLNRLFKYKKVKQASLGYFRMLDIIKEEEQLHPVIHILMPTIRSYFQGRYYIKLSEWSSYWRRALDMNPDYNLSLNVNVLNNKSDQQSITDKMENGLILLHNESDKAPARLDDPITSRRMIGYSRLLKEQVDLLQPKFVYNLQDYNINDAFANNAFEFILDWHPGLREDANPSLKQLSNL
ncbi:protein rep [Paenibacillus motobuensis]|uniref:Replication protein n=1 Tax=Paenibacillus motobuensis TaxID=295324 RepID=A0ABP3I405_9BACL